MTVTRRAFLAGTIGTLALSLVSSTEVSPSTDVAGGWWPLDRTASHIGYYEVEAVRVDGSRVTVPSQADVKDGILTVSWSAPDGESVVSYHMRPMGSRLPVGAPE